MTIPNRVASLAIVVCRPMEDQHKFRVQIRQYPRAGGTTWRWWVFDRRGGTHLDTGIIVAGDRDDAGRAANNAVERLRKGAWSPKREVDTPLQGPRGSKQGCHQSQ